MTSGTSVLSLDPISLVSGEVVLPGSKSLSNRVLLLSLLAEGTTTVTHLLESDDVRWMVEALKTLGIPFMEQRDQQKIEITGCGGFFPVNQATLFLGNAGTAMRSLTAALTLGQGTFILDGVERMRERPIGDLVEGLQQLGANLGCAHSNGCPPIEIEACGLRGGTAVIGGSVSSQFLSALLMVAPYAEEDVHIMIKDRLVSKPYVAMTLKLMQQFGVTVAQKNYQEFHILGRQRYRSPGFFAVEGDASSASYFLAGAAITGGTVTVHGCGSQSVQGDVHFADVLEHMGAQVTWGTHSITVTGGSLQGVDISMGDMPDAAMTLAVVALFAKGKTAIRDIYNWRLKETERMVAVRTELEKLGALVEEGSDYLIITPPEQIHSAAIDTYEDHRMAMAFSLAACGSSSIQIRNPECVSKTFPDYFKVFNSLIIKN